MMESTEKLQLQPCEVAVAEQECAPTLEQQVAEATPFELVYLLMSGAVERMEEARRHAGQQDWREMMLQLEKIEKIVSHLRLSLDLDMGQEFARELDEVYLYIQQQLGLAKVERREVLIGMAQSAMQQIASVWNNGMEQWALVEGSGEPIPHTLLCHLKPVPMS
jgi:flagellar protein FliS